MSAANIDRTESKRNNKTKNRVEQQIHRAVVEHLRRRGGSFSFIVISRARRPVLTRTTPITRTEGSGK